jgi:hypothetical protein
MASLFDFVNDLSHGKKHLLDEDPDNEKAVNQFMINRAFSFGSDTIMYANEMNKATGIDNRMLYDYYFNALRPRKRFNKWLKAAKADYLPDVVEYFSYGYQKASDALKILTEDQLKQIRSSLNKGGKTK